MSRKNKTQDFSFATLPTLEKKVFRMGVAGNYGIDSSDIRWAAEHGANYWLWGLRFNKVAAGIRDVIAKDRDRHVVAFLGWGLSGRQVRRGVEKALSRLNTDYLDVFKLGWLGRTSVYTRNVTDSLLKLKQEGKIKAIGTSIHDRQRAGRLALDPKMDLLMIRYNAKHTGAEQDIFPHLKERGPAVVGYTALAWGQLIKPLKKIDAPPLTPGLCYRFALSSPHVHVVLTGPQNRDQLKANFQALEQGPLDPHEMERVRRYGKQVKAKRKLDYIR
jgi:aryl-alcohol dehydrogenase-like predicted oxidoreductase